MKLIVAGSTGFVATELIRQALSHPVVTTIIALARRPTPVPQNVGPGADTAKLKSVVCEDFENYPESVKEMLKGADACVWLIAITPSKSKVKAWDEVRKICLDYTLTGIKVIAEAQQPRQADWAPLRFIYTSGANAERDPTKKPWILGEYCLMRGETECEVLSYASASSGSVEACIAKPGLLIGNNRSGMAMNALKMVMTTVFNLSTADVKEAAAALLEQATVVRGMEKETLTNGDLVRIGRRVLEERKERDGV